MFSIRSSGETTHHATVEELSAALSANHRGEHVSIGFKHKNSGIDGVHWVSVGCEGDVYDAYIDEELYDFSKLTAIAQIS
jgi:hypothetical protein